MTEPLVGVSMVDLARRMTTVRTAVRIVEGRHGRAVRQDIGMRR
jgi:hypothetical protein